MDIFWALVVLAILGGIGYGLWRFKIGPFKPKTVGKAPLQRKGKEPTPPPPVEPPPTEPPPAP